MGRPKRAVAVAETEDGDTEAVQISDKGRIGREKAKKSYREDSEHSDEEEAVVASKKFVDPKDKDFSDEEDVVSPSESEGSEWDGESSGSEYGKKKKSVAKKAGGRGRGRKSASPAKGKKGRGRGRPSAGGSASKNGKKAVKRGRGDDSEDESESEGDSSGSEYGSKKKKPLIPSPKKRTTTPKAKAKSSPRGRVSSPSTPEEGRARRGRPAASKSYKEMSEDDIEEVSDDDKPKTKKAKLEPKASAAAKPKEKPEKKETKKKDDESDEEEPEEPEDESMEDEEEEEDKVASKKKTNKKEEEETKKKNGTPAKEKNDKDKMDEDEEEEDDDDDDDVDDKEEEKKEKKKEVVVKAKADKNGHGKSKSSKDSEDEEDANSLDDDASDKEDDEVDDNEDDGKKTTTITAKNKVDTDYSKIDFETAKKSSKGESSNYKIACWNIGGIKAWLKKNGLEYLKKEDPDIFCLNEVKCNDKTKPGELSKLENYPHLYWSFNAERSGESGVAIFSKVEAKSVEKGFPEGGSDADDKKFKQKFNKEGRLLTVEFDEFYLINAYVPNSGRPEKGDDNPPKVANGERQKFDELFREYVKELEKKKSVIVTGDLNVAHEPQDLANPKTNTRTAGFTQQERDGMTLLLEETSLFDSFRALYPDQKGTYTFWSYMHASRQKNIGWRLDYFLMSEKLRDSLCDSLMRTEVYGSDHCPIVLFMRK